MSGLVSVIQTPLTTTIQAQKRSYYGDFLRGTVQMVYPTMLTVGMGFLISITNPKYVFMIYIFYLLFFGTQYWFPILIRTGNGLFRTNIITLNRQYNTLQVNGVDWASFSEVGNVRLLTRISPFAYRRFRVELFCASNKWLTVVDTPIVTEFASAGKYRMQLEKDRVRYSTDFLEDYFMWQEYQSGMGGYDRDDPLIKEIFVVYHTLCTLLGFSATATMNEA